MGLPTSAPPHPKTPPRDSKPVPHSTPISHKFSGDYTFNSESIDAKTARMRLAEETFGHYVGPMPPATFSAKFLPRAGGIDVMPEVNKALFKKVPETGKQKPMYDALKAAISPFCPNKELVYTHANVDPEYNVAPDVGIGNPSNRRSSDPVTCFRSLDGWMELKGSRDVDPFHDPGKNDERQDWDFERLAGGDTRGQLASYAAAHRDSSYRLHSFSLFIHGSHARFMRWGVESVIVTERFDYKENPDLLAEFLWRFSHASPVMLGEDPTVTPASEEESKLCRDLLNLSPNHLIVKLDIPSRADPKQTAPYLAPRQTCRVSSPFGRGTRSTQAVKLEDQSTVFLKDYHRADAPGLIPEGETYERLEEAAVPHIATFDRGNDIVGHRSVGQLYSNEPWACTKAYGTTGISTYEHYRMSLSTVGRPLTEFNSSLELAKAISDAMEGAFDHMRPRTRRRISTPSFFTFVLHRDISVGNILIIRNGDEVEGLLIDWDLSAVVDGSGNSIRLRKRRTGTWQFISCNLLQDSSHMHTLLDDRESCLWVFIWITLRYSETSLSTEELQGRLRAFDECYFGEESAKGGQLKQGMLTNANGEIKLPAQSGGLGDLLQELRQSFALRYIDKQFMTDDFAARLAEMGERGWLSDVFQRHLKKDGWPTSDKAKSQSVEKPRTSSRKRTSEQAELDSRVGSLSQARPPSQLASCCKKQKSGQADRDEGYSEGHE